MAEWWASTDLILYIDKEDLKKYYGKEHGYLVMNHRYEVDWLMGWVLCDRVNILGVSGNIFPSFLCINLLFISYVFSEYCCHLLQKKKIF